MFLFHQMSLLPVLSCHAILGHSYTKIMPVVYLKFNLTEGPIFYQIVKDLNLREILSLIQGKPQHEDPL